MKIGIVACGAIVREMIAIANRQEWDFELTAVPAQLHNRPEKIAPAIVIKLDEWAGQYDLILVGYADCGTSGELDKALERYDHVVRIPGHHCYDFYGGEAFARQSEETIGTYYTTDFLARHFDGLVWKGMGLDRHPQLLPIYFGNYTHLMYMRQLTDQDESERAKEAAARIGLEYLEIDTGVDELERRLVALVDGMRNGHDEASAPAPSA